MKRFHEMWVVIPNRWYRCSRCHYEGDLVEAIRHAIEQQEPA